MEGGGSGGGDNSPPPCIEGAPCAHKVLIGWAQLTHQYDGLFAGGSEIKFASVDGIKHFESDDDPDLIEIYVSAYFNRTSIHKDHWHELNVQFDQNWEDYELAKDFKIYEADGNGIDEINLGIDIEGIGGIDFGIKLSDDRANIFKTTYQRDVFFAENNYDIGNGLRDGVAIRQVGGVHWTMPILEIGLQDN